MACCCYMRSSVCQPDQTRLFDALDAGFGGRVVSTSGSALEAEVAGGQFRSDLHVRLSGIEIPVPPLRDRTEDAVWLLSELFGAMNARRDHPLRGVSALAEEAMRAHDWPGNGREVRSRLVRGISLAEGEWLFPADLFPERRAAGSFRRSRRRGTRPSGAHPGSARANRWPGCRGGASPEGLANDALGKDAEARALIPPAFGYPNVAEYCVFRPLTASHHERP